MAQDAASLLLPNILSDNVKLQTATIRLLQPLVANFFHAISQPVYLARLTAIAHSSAYAEEDRKNASLLLSQVFFHLNSQEKALDFALLAGDAFEYKKETPYVYTIADQAISRYGKVRRQLEDGKIGQKYRNEQISREKKDKEQVEAKKDMDKDEDDDNEILKLQLQEIEDDLSELIIDEKLEVLYGKLVDYSFEKEEYKEIIGLGFEGIRIDVVERCIRKVNEKEQQRKKKDLERREKKKDINKSGMDKDEQFDKEDRKDNKDISSFDIMDYCFNLSNDFTTETGFRRSVCKLLVKIYGETDQDNEDYEYDIEQNEQQQLLKEEDEVLRIEREKKKKIKQQFVRIFGMAKCLCVLEDSQQLGKILARLLREGSSESYACALQIAFDIYDSGTQDICINVILVLRAEELYELKKEEDLVIQSESDSSSTKQQDKQQLYKKRRIREITRRIVSIEQILQGEKSTQLYLQFLSSKANIDKQDVLDLEVDKQSFLLLGAMLGNGIMHCGTIKDAFNAAHWNRFNVAASFGLIHRGHNKVAFNVLKDYLPTTNSLKDVQQKISEIEKKEEQEKKKDEEIGYIEEDDYVEAKKEQEQKPDVEQPPIQQQPQQQPSIFPLSTPQQSSSSTAPTGQQEPSHLFPTNTNQNQNTIPADLIGSVMRGSLGQGNRGGRGGRRGGRGQGNVDPNQFIQEQFGQQTGLNGQGQGNDPSPYSEAGALFGLGLIFGGNGASSSLSTSILGSSSSSSSTASLAAVNPLSQSTSQMPQLFSSSYSSSPIPSISSLVLPYLLSTLDELQATSPNYVVHQHGLALAIGSVGMGSKDSILANTLLQIVMQDNANAGEAACIGIGLIMLGTGSLSGLLYEQLLQVAHQTKHEKIVRAVGVGIGLIFAGQKSEADIIISELCMDSDELLRYGGVFTIGTAYAGCPLSSVVSKLFTIAATDPSGDVKRQAVISLGLLYASTGNGSNTQINYEKKEEKKDLKKDEKKETKNIKSRSSSPSLNAAPIQSKISPPPQSISSTPSPAPPSAQSTSQQTSSQSSSSSIDTTFNSQSIDMFIRSLFPLCDSFDPNIRAGVGLALGIAVSGSAFTESAARLLMHLQEDIIGYVRQTACIGLGFTYMLRGEDDYKYLEITEKLRKILVQKNAEKITKFGAQLGLGIMNAGGRNMSLRLFADQKTPRLSAIAGLSLFTQYWYWHAYSLFLAFALHPTALIAVDTRLRIPEYSFHATLNPKRFGYAQHRIIQKVQEQKQAEPVKLSVSKTTKKEDEIKKNGEQPVTASSSSTTTTTSSTATSTDPQTDKKDGEKKEDEKKEEVKKEEVKKEEDKKEEVKKDEKGPFYLKNPTRVVPEQRKYVEFVDIISVVQKDKEKEKEQEKEKEKENESETKMQKDLEEKKETEQKESAMIIDLEKEEKKEEEILIVKQRYIPVRREQKHGVVVLVGIGARKKEEGKSDGSGEKEFVAASGTIAEMDQELRPPKAIQLKDDDL